jgi:class 3 adenylate cyclase
MPTPEEYRSAGLYDPVEHNDGGRLELLDWLGEHGLSIDDMVDALERDAIGSTLGDRRLVPGERLDRKTAIERSGLSPDDFDRLSTALGFVAIDGSAAADIRYVESEIEAFAAFGGMVQLFTKDAAIDLLRVIGSALGRVAEASVSLFLADVESPHLLAGLNELELARKVYEATGLVDQLARNFEAVYRRQILQATERTRQATIDEVERILYRYAVGFVDLVGFTPVSGDMPARELADFMARFEGRAHDVASAHGARVVKLIGDEVMFVATDPSAASRAGRGLMEAFVDAVDGVTPRGGLAYGDVVLRGGDYYGPVVNLASRLVDEAVPLELLVSDELAEAAIDCEFEPAGRRMVKGFDHPITVRSMLMH